MVPNLSTSASSQDISLRHSSLELSHVQLVKPPNVILNLLSSPMKFVVIEAPRGVEQVSQKQDKNSFFTPLELAFFGRIDTKSNVSNKLNKLIALKSQPHFKPKAILRVTKHSTNR